MLFFKRPYTIYRASPMICPTDWPVRRLCSLSPYSVEGVAKRTLKPAVKPFAEPPTVTETAVRTNDVMPRDAIISNRAASADLYANDRSSVNRGVWTHPNHAIKKAQRFRIWK